MIFFLFKTVLLLLCSFNFFLPKIILLLLLCYCIIVLYHNNSTYKITVQTLRINNIVIFCLITLLFCLIYIILFSYWRYLNLNKQLDLKIIIYKIYLILMNNNLFNNFIILSYTILFMIIMYFSISILRKYFFIHFFKIHLYITYLTYQEDVDDDLYEKLQLNLLFNNYIFSKIFIYKPIKLLHKIIKKYDPTYSEDEHKFLFDIIYKFRLIEHGIWFPKYLFTIFLIYDIIYNNMIITKIYYLLLILSLYYIFHQIINIMCFIYRKDCIRIYSYLYINTCHDILDENDIRRINNDLAKLDIIGKPGLPINYKEKIIYDISIPTYIFLINIVMMLHIIITKNVQILYLQQIINIYFISYTILYILILSWFFFNKLFFKYVFISLTIIISICWLTLVLRHNVPLLFNEVIINNKYVYIIDSYIIQEQIYFIKEYIKYHIDHCHTNLENIPLIDIVNFYNNITELKIYAENLITLIKKMELAYENHFSRLLIKTIMEIFKENIINPSNNSHNIPCLIDLQEKIEPFSEIPLNINDYN